MAVEGSYTSTEEVRTDGKSWGPVSSNVTYAGLIATVLVFIAGAFGLVIPTEVALAFTTLLMAGVAWFSRGRKVVETTHVIQPIPKGTGAHRAEQPLGENNE